MTERGVYVHLPFCVRKCNYCDFLSGPASLRTMEAYVDCLIEEIRMMGAEKTKRVRKLKKEQLKISPEEFAAEKYSVTSIFLGGGTPSILPGEWARRIVDAIREAFLVAEDTEITIECNPGTVTMEKLQAYRKAGINRISFGLQSVHEEELHLLGRIHSFDQFLESYEMARRAGFSNINVDLMSALPGQTFDSWKETLRTVAQLNPPPEHISAYSLIIEPGTPFYETYGEHEELLPDEDTDREMYAFTKAYLAECGYHRYEISNYARDGYESRHNNYYWTGEDYLGFGIGAASLDEGVRYKGVDSVQYYIQSMELAGTTLADMHREVEQLSLQDRQEEFMFLGLRRMAGVSVKEFERRFGVPFAEVYGEVAERLVKEGLLQKVESVDETEQLKRAAVSHRIEYRPDVRYALTERGIDVSNVVLAEFLQE